MYAPTDNPKNSPIVDFPTNPPNITPPTVPHKPSRRITRLAWMQDYVCPLIFKSNNCFNNKWEYACTINLQELMSFNEANKYEEWRVSMNEKLKALEENETLELT